VPVGRLPDLCEAAKEAQRPAKSGNAFRVRRDSGPDHGGASFSRRSAGGRTPSPFKCVFPSGDKSAAAEADQRGKLERLCRYIARPAVAASSAAGR
jgi:hypothetical protein